MAIPIDHSYNEIVITNKNDMFVTLETIAQLEPGAILDIGMFFKRIGCISRTIMDYTIPKNTILDGIDLYEHLSFPVWNNIYNKIICYQGSASIPDYPYQLVIALGIQRLLECMNLPDLSALIKMIKYHAHYLLINEYTGLRAFLLQHHLDAHYIQSEEYTYYLIKIGEQ